MQDGMMDPAVFSCPATQGSIKNKTFSIVLKCSESLKITVTKRKMIILTGSCLSLFFVPLL